MLRITHTSKESSAVTLKLEGRIVSDWVPLVREECLRILKEKKSVWLDCSDVIFVDDRGVEMLKAMAGQGIKLVHCSPFIEGLLREGENP